MHETLESFTSKFRFSAYQQKVLLGLLGLLAITCLGVILFLFHHHALAQALLDRVATQVNTAQKQASLHLVQRSMQFQRALDTRLHMLHALSVDSVADTQHHVTTQDYQSLVMALDLNGISSLLHNEALNPLPMTFWNRLGAYSLRLAEVYDGYPANMVARANMEWVQSLTEDLRALKRIHGAWFDAQLNVFLNASALGGVRGVSVGEGRESQPLAQEVALSWVEQQPEAARRWLAQASVQVQAHRQSSYVFGWAAVAIVLVACLALTVVFYGFLRHHSIRLLTAIQRRLQRPDREKPGVLLPTGYFNVLGQAIDDVIAALLARLDASERALSELRAMVSDQSLVYQTIRAEVETPVTGLMLAIDRLGQSSLDGAQREHVANIRQHGRNVGRLISDFLGFASLEAEVSHAPWTPCHLLGLVECALSVGGIIMSERDVELLLCCSEDMPSHVQVDVEALNLIIHNLLRHVVHATQYGDIEIRLSPIHPDELPSIKAAVSLTQSEAARNKLDDQAQFLCWDPSFIRLTITYSSDEPEISQLAALHHRYSYHEVARYLECGAGLGLLVAKRKVELLGGVVQTEMEAGANSCIQCYIPYLPVVDHRPDPYQPLLAWRGLKVLIVVTSRALRTMLSDLVYQWGFIPFVVTSMAQAKELLRNQRQQMACVLCDMDALSISDRQWYRYFKPTIPFFYLARVGQVPVFEHPLVGSSSVLTKPITPKVLHEAFSRLLKDSAEGQRLHLSAGITSDSAANTNAETGAAEQENDQASERMGRVLQSASVELVAQTLRAPRILLVEDNEVNIGVTKGLLNSLGFEIDVAVDGEEGWVLICRNRYELVFMDLQLPRLDGISLALRLRDANLREKPKVIALTANATVEDRNQCRQAGMVDFIAKPFRRAELARCLTQWLGKPAL